MFGENKTVTIPLGASNPHTETEAQFWYTPPVTPIHVGDTVTWENTDNEIHTVTSGKGSGRIGFTENNFGTPDGYFNSGSFKPGQSWSFTFNKTGTFYYFCTIHPWMEGAVIVSNAIPENPVNSYGIPITKWPIVAHTQDQTFESDLAWEPHVILTGQKTIFVFQFYNPMTSEVLPNTYYEFVVVQNGKELLRTSGYTDVGGDYKYFVFQDSGPVTFRFEKIGKQDLSTEYSTVVYNNPSDIKESVVIQPARNVLLGQVNAIVLLLPAIAAFGFMIFFLKGWLPRKKT